MGRCNLGRLVVTALALLTLTSSLVLAQEDELATRAAVVAKIEQFAASHVASGAPQQTQFVVDLLADNDAGLSRLEIAEIYDAAYARQRELQKPSVWDQLRPNLGWVAFVLLLVAVALHEALKKWVTALIEGLGRRIRSRLAGSRFIASLSLRKYQTAIAKSLSEVKVGFRPNRPLTMNEVYVPLSFKNAEGNEVDAYQTILRSRRLMVHGPPGSGKSILLRSVALAYADGRFAAAREPLVPVLLQLHRLSDRTQSLRDYIVDEFDRNDFPNAGDFVDHNLPNGILLLLDGLDEINSFERASAIREIRDLLEKHENCRAVITCRTAVYGGEFADLVNETVEITSLSDQQIRQYLMAWEPDMAEGKSVEQLMRTFRGNPKILLLARNPLLLTIVAYLYTDTEYTLPNSRAEFYRQSTDLLLRQKQEVRNRFESRDKHQILRHLALYFQDRSDLRSEDRRTVDYKTVLAETRNIMPELGLPEKTKPEDVLREIVERSGLLLELEGGERYGFAHLTLQEYFAAACLDNDEAKLLNRFEKDRDAWRETVKLWCGLASDSTDVIEKVFAIDPITAFECLGDTQKISPATSHKVVEFFKGRLGTDEQSEAVERAFGAVAADPSQRGKAILAYLIKEMKSAVAIERRSAAAAALASTNRLDAAKAMAERYVVQPEVRTQLVRMDDLAVPELARLAQSASLDALDDLQTIGTPQAAAAVATNLWSSSEVIAARAAWALAGMLPQPTTQSGFEPNPQIETILAQRAVTEAERRAHRLDWVESVFDGDAGTSTAIGTIGGRIAYLLANGPAQAIPAAASPLDPRVTFPVLAIEILDDLNLGNLEHILSHPTVAEKLTTIADMQGGRDSRIPGALDTLIGSADPPAMTKGKDQALSISRKTFTDVARYMSIPPYFAPGTDSLQDAGEDLFNAVMRIADPNPRAWHLWAGLPAPLRAEVCRMIGASERPTRDDWLRNWRSAQFASRIHWHTVACLALAGIVSLIALAQMVRVWSAAIPNSQATWLIPVLALALIASFATLVVGRFLGDDELDADAPWRAFFVYGLLGPLVAILGVILGLYDNLRPPVTLTLAKVVTYVQALITGSWVLIVGYFVSTAILEYTSLVGVGVVWLGILAFWAVNLFVIMRLLLRQTTQFSRLKYLFESNVPRWSRA